MILAEACECRFFLRVLPPLTRMALARDATEAFEDVGHSDEARALLKDMLVGDFEKTDVRSCLPLLLLYLHDTQKPC